MFLKSLALTRRGVLSQGLAAGAALALSEAATAQSPDPLSGAALFRDVERYAAFGDHQTATPADVRTSQWLRDELARAGVKARLAPWTHQQFFLRRQGLRLEGGADVESFPLWWSLGTGPRGVTAPLGELRPGADLRRRIAFIAVPPVQGSSVRPGDAVGRLVVDAAGQGALGLVIVTRDPAGEVVALNAMAGLSPWPIPVLCVGGRDEARLRSAISAQQSATIVIEGELDYAAKAYEVIGSLDRGPRRIVVSTPSSGWFQCAGERGPGIALWLALARWAARQKSDLSYTFVASSGHELESMGIRHFVGHDAPPAARTTSWLHLGAGIATYAYEFGPGGRRRLPTPHPARRLMTNDPAMMPLLKAQFDALPSLAPTLTERPGGEMIVMARQGYRVWGFAGGSAFHHMRSDKPELVTGPELLEPVARATAATLREFA